MSTKNENNLSDRKRHQWKLISSTLKSICLTDKKNFWSIIHLYGSFLSKEKQNVNTTKVICTVKTKQKSNSLNLQKKKEIISTENIPNCSKVEGQ